MTQKSSDIPHILTIINLLRSSKENQTFNIISFNCESINAKFDQLNIYINLFASNGCELHAIRLQETWLSSDADTSLLELEGYTLISKGKHISERGGLIIYLKDSIKFKIIDIY